MAKEIVIKDEPCYDMNWTRNVPAPADQSCNYTAEAWDQVTCPEMAAHKEAEKATGNGYHNVPAPGEAINYDYEN